MIEQHNHTKATLENVIFSIKTSYLILIHCIENIGVYTTGKAGVLLNISIIIETGKSHTKYWY